MPLLSTSGLRRVPWICASEGGCSGHVEKAEPETVKVILNHLPVILDWLWAHPHPQGAWPHWSGSLYRTPASWPLKHLGHGSWASGTPATCLLTPQDCACGPHTLDMQEAPECGGSDAHPSNTSSSTQVTCSTCRGHAGGDTQMYATAPPTGNRRQRSNYRPFKMLALSSSAGKGSAANVADLGSTPGFGRSPEEGEGYPLQYSGLENSMDCIAHGVTKNRTWLSNIPFP